MTELEAAHYLYTIEIFDEFIIAAEKVGIPNQALLDAINNAIPAVEDLIAQKPRIH